MILDYYLELKENIVAYIRHQEKKVPVLEYYLCMKKNMQYKD